MKKLILGTLVGLAMASSAAASVVTLDYSKVAGASGTINFDTIDFPPFFPVSYYIDETENGFVDDGEFVFDFGTDLEVGTLQLGTSNTAIGTGSTAPYRLVADYLLIGEAVVTDGEAAALLQAGADFDGVSLNAYIDSVLAVTGNCSAPGGFARDCAAIARVNGENLLDGLNGNDPTAATEELLAANLTEGIFNLFLADTSGQRVGFAGSFGVTNTQLNFGGQINLEIDGALVQAEQGLLFDEYGNSFADILADGTALPPTLTFKTTIQDSSRLPGTLQSQEVGTNNPAGNANGEQLYYYTDTNLTVAEVTAMANTCPGFGGSNPGDISFGGCSSIIGANGPADSLWDDLRATVRAAGGCASDSASASCSLNLLARTTQLDGNATIEATAPGTLMISALGLMMLGFRRKFF
ncbi:hypothetical protein GTQ48_02005 [Alteromonas genovensis]|uniref:PEP-CTERM sorting domain-containing protein n=1 Tax=Alteromonas genovensis TaxID=471225 RepID=A0A6N9TFI9_9ALTE|nr:hypothetical protein [Alteromonas genovensis]NDW14309.1 hypothetical protein [Alteromonas genovensis]